MGGEGEALNLDALLVGRCVRTIVPSHIVSVTLSLLIGERLL